LIKTALVYVVFGKVSHPPRKQIDQEAAKTFAQLKATLKNTRANYP
jgi:hypothetical protein